MRVFNNDQTLYVGWHYDNPNDAKRTDIIVKNNQKEIVATATIIRHVHDKHDKEKARRFSLAKLLKQEFPGRENKPIRTAFWDAYRFRNQVKEPV